jgi:AAA domain/Bifunctional DNA primase/polymerase, N-terminal/Primase C terminal 1 (PriCT-1)/Winged helix-turn-helix DNA-binding
MKLKPKSAPSPKPGTVSSPRKLRTAAIGYAKDGVAVIPLFGIRDGVCECRKKAACKHPGKHPRILGWQERATSNVSQVAAWWDKWPNSNIGIPTGAVNGIVVIDVDGPVSLAEVEALETDSGSVATLRAKTGRPGGAHRYYTYESWVKNGKLHGNAQSKTDIKTDGGYVVGAPSNHISGRTYEFTGVDGFDRSLLTPPPEWLKHPPINSKPDGTSAPGTDIPEGSRNSTLTSLAGRLRRAGLGYDDILAALIVQNASRCKPPLERDELETIACSIAGRLSGTPPLQVTTVEELLTSPPTSYLIDHVLAARTTVVLYGEPGSGKTLIALEMAFCLASGLPWQGHNVIGGPVLYLATEGHAALPDRLRALCSHHGVHLIPHLKFLNRGVDLTDRVFLGAFEELVEREQPTLVVVDTMARAIGTGEENSSRDVNALIGNLEALRERCPGLTVLVLHHPAKSSGDLRGSSAIKASADLVLHCTLTDQKVTISPKKGRDTVSFEPLTLTLRPEGQSVVLANPSSPTRKTKPTDTILAHLEENGPQTSKQLQEALGLGKSAVATHLKTLTTAGKVSKHQQGKSVLYTAEPFLHQGGLGGSSTPAEKSVRPVRPNPPLKGAARRTEANRKQTRMKFRPKKNPTQPLA